MERSVLSMCLAFVFLSCCVSSTISSGPFGGPAGLLFPYGDRTGRDGTRYKTDYRCEGENMTIVCDEDDEYDRRIEVVRGNFGRFSIAICNQHGHTDWNVNCMSPSTTKRLKTQCDSLKSCTISVDSTSFPEDSCPGTFKYLEVHYACTSNTAGAKNPPPPPPWINPWIGKASSGLSNSSGILLNYSSSTTSTPSTPPPRKPILVTEKAVTKRIPITTPKSEELEVSTTSSSLESISENNSTTTDFTSTPRSSTDPSPSFPPSPSSLDSHILSNPVSRPRFDQDSLYASPDPEDDLEDNSYLYHHHQDPRLSPCPPTTARNLQWNWTKRGELSIQQCPIGTTGIARWYCSPEGVWTPTGRPDMSDCKAIAMSNLEAQVRAEDPVNVLISSLAYLTRTKSLYGGDLESSAGIMRTVTNLIQYRFQSSSRSGKETGGESLIAEVLQNVMRSVSHILEKSNNQAWMDLTAERRMKVATSLLLSLEENAFLLAGVMNHPENSLDSSELLTMAIYVVDTRLTRSGVFFPPNQLPYVKDSVYISPEDVKGSGRFNRLTEIVFFSFANLHVVLNDAKMTLTSDLNGGEENDSSESKDPSKRWTLNSRIVSASLGRGGRHVELMRPVTLVLKHIRESDNKYLHTPKCVFWNYETHGWSDAGCRVRESNSSHTVCSCDHLTNFAVAMMEDIGALGSISSDSGIDPGLMTIIQIVAAIGVSVIIILIVIIFLIVKYGGSIKKWCGRRNCCNKRGGASGGGASSVSSEMEKCQRNFYTGLSPHSTKVMSSLNDRSYSQYVLNAPSSNSGALQQLVGSSSSSSSTSSTTSGMPNGGGNNSSGSTLSSSTEPKGGRSLLRASNISSGVPHITLNPYSSQLVENINMMMPPGSDKAEVVYRAVSPHGHVYWEIDPQQQQHLGGPGYYPENPVEIEETIRRNNLAESHPLMAFHHAQVRHSAGTLGGTHHPHHHLPSSSSTFHHHHRASELNHQQQQQLSTSSTFFNTSHMSSALSNGGGFVVSPSPPITNTSCPTPNTSSQQQQIVPEQLQRQVQIRDIKSIPVSVKSSEYIEAKIRTLRASHHQQQQQQAQNGAHFGNNCNTLSNNNNA